MGDYLLTHPFIEPLHDQSYFQSCTLDDRHRVLMRGILQIGVVYGENAVAHLQHVALVSGTGGNDVLDEDARDFIAPTDVHLEREGGNVEGTSGGGLIKRQLLFHDYRMLINEWSFYWHSSSFSSFLRRRFVFILSTWRNFPGDV